MPFARLVESTEAEWVHIQPDDDGGADRDMYQEKSKRVLLDKSLLSSLVDRWRPETHTFHLPCGEMAPTLQDVSYLLGLPLAGTAIGPLEASEYWRDEMQARFAAALPGVLQLPDHAHGPRVSWLTQFQVIYLYNSFSIFSMNYCILIYFSVHRRLVIWDILLPLWMRR